MIGDPRDKSVVERALIIDEPHNDVAAELLKDGTIRLMAGSDPHEYAVLQPDQAAKVVRELAFLLERATRPLK